MEDKILMMLGRHPTVLFAYPIPTQAHIAGMLTTGQGFVITIGKMSQEQKDFQQLVRDNGGIALCCDSPDSVDFGLSQ